VPPLQAAAGRRGRCRVSGSGGGNNEREPPPVSVSRKQRGSVFGLFPSETLPGLGCRGCIAGGVSGVLESLLTQNARVFSVIGPLDHPRTLRIGGGSENGKKTGYLAHKKTPTRTLITVPR